MRDDLFPVSYTHLDVYKRQEDAALLIFGLDANVILQTFDVENVFQLDLDQFVVAFYENGIRHISGNVLCPAHLDPP